MPSLLHRGMIAGNSIVWKPVSEIKAGDTLIMDAPDQHDGLVYTVKVTAVKRWIVKGFGYEGCSVSLDNGYTWDWPITTMLRVPPQNPRVK